MRRKRAAVFMERASRSLATKLFLLLLASLLLVLSVLGFLNIRLHRRNLERATLASAERVSDVIKRSTSYYMMRNDREALYHIIRTMADEPGMERVRIFNQEGKISFSTSAAEIDRYVDKRAEACYGCHSKSQPLTRLDRPDRFRIYHVGKQRVLGIINPITNSPSCSNAACHAHPPEQKVLGVLDTDLSLAAADESLRSSTRQMYLYSAAGALAISILSGLFLWQLVHRPIKLLQRGTKKLRDGQLGYQIELRSNDELGALATSFDIMSRQLSDAREESDAWARTLEDRVEAKSQELQRAHQQMLRAEKLASLGKMAAVVAHEINNPLSGILTYSKLMRKWIERGDSMEERKGEMRESLTLIESESRRCGEIVRNLLNFARAAPLNTGAVDVNEVLRHVIRLVGHKIELGNIVLELELEEGLPSVRGDAAQLEQVFLALIINAIEAMPREGTLRLRTWAGEASLGIEIEDDGVGISAEIVPHLFEPFFTTKEDAKGVGLGLAVSRSIVERHEGTIDVSSQPGRGTRITIVLPLLAPRNQSQVEQLATAN